MAGSDDDPLPRIERPGTTILGARAPGSGLQPDRLPRIAPPAPGVRLLAYTDGGCRGNPGPGGWGFVLIDVPSGRSLAARGGDPQTTNNKMELTAALELLRALKRPGQAIELRTDSTYLRNICTRWLPGWKRNGFRTAAKKPVKNQELVRALDGLLGRHRIHWTWVKGHSGEPGNEYADQLANHAMDAMARGADASARLRLEASPFRWG